MYRLTRDTSGGNAIESDEQLRRDDPRRHVRGLSGRKRVDVDRFYDVAHYRPKVADVMGPMFLTDNPDPLTRIASLRARSKCFGLT